MRPGALPPGECAAGDRCDEHAAGQDKIILVHALMKTGAVLLPISPKLSPEERAKAIESCDVSVDLDDPGSSPRPKPTCRCSASTTCRPALPHPDQRVDRQAHTVSFPTATISSARWAPPSTSASTPPTAGCALPTSHISGLSIVMRSVIYGTAMVLQDHFEPEAITDAIERDRATVISLVSTMLLRLLDEGST